MGRATVILNSKSDRDKAVRLLINAPTGTRVEFKAARRSLPQNDRMWAMLTDVASQVVWHGQKYRPEDWKIILMSGLKRELRAVPNIAGDGFVEIGTSSSDLSKQEMTELIELIFAFGAQNGVTFHDDRVAA